MKVKIKLLSDAIFGSGQSIPGGEDIAVCHDAYGFPYISGSSVKGVLREEIENYFEWIQKENSKSCIEEIFGCTGDKTDRNKMNEDRQDRLTVSDFVIPLSIRKAVTEELEILDEDKKQRSMDFVLELFTDIRTFTRIEDGKCKDGSLRNARCIKKGLIFEGEILCRIGDEELIRECLSYVKWLGTMRTRGFGNVVLEGVQTDGKALYCL